MHRRITVVAASMAALFGMFTFGALAQKAPLSLTVSNDGTKTLHFPLTPGLDSLTVKSGTNLNSMGVVNPVAVRKSATGYTYTASNQFPAQFYSLQLQQMSSNALISANLLNRIAYGPTPDELERLAVIGPDAYINEQLAPETVPSTVDSYSSVKTNGVSLPPNTNWTLVTVTGNVSSATLYIYMRAAGQVNVDAVELHWSYVLTAITNTGGVLTTNVYTNYTANVLTNGDFEAPFTTPWTIAGSTHTGSFRDTGVACSGSASLRVVATAAGTGSGNAIQQICPNAPATARGTNGTGQIWTNTVSVLRSVVKFAYLPTPTSHMLTIRLSGDGTVGSGNDQASDPEWVYATATGQATATPTLYIYTSGRSVAEAFVDDVKLVAGTVPEAGPNLLVNGDFEQPFSTGWRASTNFDLSYVDNTVSHSGSGSLHVISETAGSGSGSAIFQTNLPLVNGQTYTVSYWYRPATPSGTMNVRLSGSLLNSVPDNQPSGIKRRLDRADFSASLEDLRSWHCNNAVGSPRQLLEILTQFFENHFVTQHSKSSDYFDQYYDGLQNNVATDLEFREVSRWRAALMNPDCTFYDLLKVHAESPAEIIYLDTVLSRADGGNVANENYARELLELFTMGVDNGYDQQDIVTMSRAWSGWTVDIVDRADIDNPFAARSREYGRYPGVGFNAVSNIIGVWTFVFNNTFHGTNRAPIFSVWSTNAPDWATNPKPLAGEAGKKHYAARFGPPWAGTPYQLVLPAGRTTPQTGILDGYDAIRHLAVNLHTAEFISVKLCQIFVHEDFIHGVYDYTDPNRSREAELIRQCLLAWDTPGGGTVGGRGNIRRVLRTILNSDLFREYGNTLQKVKTPLEYVASSVRALRSLNPDGSATATTDGYSFSSPLSRMGAMSLFNRAEPNGYPEYGSAWISAGTLAERVRFIQSLLTASGASPARPSDAGNNFANPVALLQKKLSANQLLNAAAVVDYLIGIIYPGEGRANLDQYRNAAIGFLNDGTADPTPSSTPFSQLTVSTSATSPYDVRVRGMVSYLMTLQRFHEQ